MLSNYIVKLLIFLILVLLISQLNKLSWHTISKLFSTKSFSKIKEGLNECSQNEKDDLFKQKLKINEIKDNATKIITRIQNLEKNIQRNEQGIRENKGKLKTVVEKSEKEQNSAKKQSESIKF